MLALVTAVLGTKVHSLYMASAVAFVLSSALLCPAVVAFVLDARRLEFKRNDVEI